MQLQGVMESESSSDAKRRKLARGKPDQIMLSRLAHGSCFSSYLASLATVPSLVLGSLDSFVVERNPCR